ncbi:MAG: 4-alpha-glucanotransferase [Clostridia bacterium]
MKNGRRSGILMHMTSLPSQEGIGTLGSGAYAFVDFLKKTNTAIWQMLPIGPTGYGESPYQSSSTFAGNPLLIDAQRLRDEGLLDLPSTPAPASAQVDFDAVKQEKTRLLARAYELSYEKLAPEIEAFRRANSWLDDYALFEALREHFGFAKWVDWPDRAIRMREEGALKHYRELLAPRVNYHAFVQYLFSRQWEKLHFYCRMNGVSLLGDLPIYVAEDSADTWANPELFKLDEERRPLKVAGVPPDYFTADGQLWGNPCYDWRANKKTDYAWWLERMRAVADRFDMVRIDHFIGFANYYAIPSGAPNARIGKWKKGPGKSLFRVIKQALPELEIIAEDLGVTGPRVKDLLKFCGYPGMHVLQFAFGTNMKNQDLPANVKKHCAYYTGTHDNATTREWYEGASPDERKNLMKALELAPDEDAPDAMIRCVLTSRAFIAVVPMQDYLGLSGVARMNTPGTVGGQNWRWRMQPGMLNEALAERIRALTCEAERGVDK